MKTERSRGGVFNPNLFNAVEDGIKSLEKANDLKNLTSYFSEC